MTYKDIKTMIREACRELTSMQKAGIKQYLMVYVAGHGAMDTMQHFVLNDTERQTINIEERLRALAATTGTSILAFYDICRTDINNIKGLDQATNKGRGGNNHETDSSGDEKDFATKYNYIHIGTHPKQIVATNSYLAELTIETLTEKA